MAWGLEEMGKPGTPKWFTLVQAQYTDGLHFVNLARYRNYSSEWKIDAWGLTVFGSAMLSKINSILHQAHEYLGHKSFVEDARNFSLDIYNIIYPKNVSF